MVQMKKKKKKNRNVMFPLLLGRPTFYPTHIFSNQQARILFYIIWYQKLHLTDVRIVK